MVVSLAVSIYECKKQQNMYVWQYKKRITNEKAQKQNKDQNKNYIYIFLHICSYVCRKVEKIKVTVLFFFLSIISIHICVKDTYKNIFRK